MKLMNQKYLQFLTIRETICRRGITKTKLKGYLPIVESVNPGNFLRKQLHQTPLPLSSLFRYNVRKEHIQKVEM